MEFSPEKIKKVAKLAKVELSESEVETFNQQFSAITKIINKLQEVDVKGVTPIHNPSQNSALMRKDIVTDGGYVEDILTNAPKHAFNCFVVPKVVE